jgi:malate permease and related proteins
MSIFLTLLTKLFPIYAVMGAGYGLSRITGNITSQIAALQIYFIVPVVITTNVMKLSFTSDVLILPVFLFFVCVLISLLVFYFSKKSKLEYSSILSQSSGTANTGYLGIPIAIILLPPELVPVYMVTMVGTTICENSLGYYFIARSNFSPKQAVLKLLKLPTLYALILGLILSAYKVQLPENLTSIARDFLGAYIILGALIIGLGVAQVKTWKFDWMFLTHMLGVKFILWPFVMWGLLQLDEFSFDIIPQSYEPILLLLSIMPLAANTAAFAAMFHVYPERTATAVAFSTLMGVVLIPFFVVLFGLSS